LATAAAQVAPLRGDAAPVGSGGAWEVQEPQGTQGAHVEERREAAPDDMEVDEDAGLDLDPEASLPTAQSFPDVVALVGEKREAKLKYLLEERVSLVKFDPAGSIELYLLPGAPKELPNELREKLNQWTGRRWMIALSKVPGDRTLGEVQKERE